MNSKEFEWDLKIVPPGKVQELREAMTGCSDEKEFFKERIEKINKQISWLEDAGRQKCYFGYKIERFGFHPKKANTGELSITRHSITRKCNVENVAFMETYYDQVITVRHNRLVKLYEEYDKNWGNFLSLEDKINAVGGEITLNRPFVDIVLPAPNSLEMVTYHNLACTSRNYSVLEDTLLSVANTKLENQFH